MMPAGVIMLSPPMAKGKNIRGKQFSLWILRNKTIYKLAACQNYSTRRHEMQQLIEARKILKGDSYG